MVLLDVKNVRKVYTTCLKSGGSIKDVNFSVERGDIASRSGIWFRKNCPSQYFSGT